MLANEIFIFLHVVKAGSLSKAAKNLGLTPAALSKAITRLETHYELKLLNRSTRSISMTEYGILLFQQSEGVLDSLKLAENQLIQAHAKPRGRIKLGAPSAFSKVILSSLLPEFLEKYNEIDIELHVNNKREYQDPNDFDLFIKAGNYLPDSAIFRAKIISKWEWVICASPNYLKNRGLPTTPQDLQSHICLDYNYRESGKIWELNEKQNDGTIISHKVKHRSNLDTSSPNFIIECAKNNGGVILVPKFAVREDIRSNQLKVILDNYFVDPINVYIMHSYDLSNIPTKVKLLMNFIADRLSGVNYNDF